MRIRPRRRKPASLALLASLLVVATPAAAADTVVAPDSTVTSSSGVTALDGTVVWVSGGPRARTLMQKSGGEVTRVKGAPQAADYRSIDLGHGEDGRLLLTSLRCNPSSTCTAYRDDLRGHRTHFRDLTPKGCALTTAPAAWRTRLAYGLTCRKAPEGRTSDPKRSGLYVVTGSGRPHRLPRPTSVESVDLRGSRVAAIATDSGLYAFSENADGTDLRSFRAGLVEGDTQELAPGLTLGTTRTLWTLSTAFHVGDPRATEISRLTGGCRDLEIITSTSLTSGFPATDIAVDGQAVYLVVPGIGITEHDFAPQHRLCGPGAST